MMWVTTTTNKMSEVHSLCCGDQAPTADDVVFPDPHDELSTNASQSPRSPPFHVSTLAASSEKSKVTVSARFTGGTGGFPPTVVVNPHVIHGIEVWALSAPRCRPLLLFS